MDAPHFTGRQQQIPGHSGSRWDGDLYVGLALASGVAVLLLALLLPIETSETDRPGVQPRYSLYHMNGPMVLLPAAIPLVVALLVGIVLYVGRHGDRSWTLPVAWTLSGALLCAAVVGFLTFLIGLFVIPTGGLLAAATGLAQSARPRRAAPGLGAVPQP
ncbi:hypothetical protein [Streptacidiphilus sp. PAMC 29251]